MEGKPQPKSPGRRGGETSRPSRQSKKPAPHPPQPETAQAHDGWMGGVRPVSPFTPPAASVSPSSSHPVSRPGEENPCLDHVRGNTALIPVGITTSFRCHAILLERPQTNPSDGAVPCELPPSFTPSLRPTIGTVRPAAHPPRGMSPARLIPRPPGVDEPCRGRLGCAVPCRLPAFPIPTERRYIRTYAYALSQAIAARPPRRRIWQAPVGS